MTIRYVLSPRAQRDLVEIWDHTERHWGSEQAESYMRRLSSSIETLATHPDIGKECFAVRAGYSKYPSGSHPLFYRQTDGGIDIVRILHERMDPQSHF